MNRVNVFFALGVLGLFTIISLALLHPLTPTASCPQSLHPSISARPNYNYNRKVHLLLPINAGAASEHAQFFCKTLFSSLVHGYEPTILNWDLELDWQPMRRMKVAGVHHYLTNLTDQNADTDLVLMVDSIDVWFQMSPKTIIQRFEESGASGVIAGAERVCFPNPEDSFACTGVPQSTVPIGAYYGAGGLPRWVNSGTVLGSVTAMRKLYNDLYKVFQETDLDGKGDQGVFNEFLAARRLSIDYHARLFYSTAYSGVLTTAQFINTPYHIDDLVPHELYPPMLYHAQTGEVPAIIHFNGPDKPVIKEWWGKLWWQRVTGGDDRFKDIVLNRVEGAVVKFPGGLKKWSDMCPKSTIGL